MVENSTIDNRYFEWLFDIVCDDSYLCRRNYRKLLKRLHDCEFTYLIPHDRNRYRDGIEFRRRFFKNDDIYLSHKECSVLEMMIALSVRIEETIMTDIRYGDRTGQWFWTMIVNLGLGDMNDDCYDDEFVDRTINRFLSRKHQKNGQGGLFFIDDECFDTRKFEIWIQMCKYLNSII